LIHGVLVRCEGKRPGWGQIIL